MSTVKVSGNATFEHSETGEILEISGADLQITSEGSNLRGMGPDIVWRVYAEIDEIEHLDWTFSEYPVGILNLPAELTVIGDYKIVKDNIVIELNHMDSDAYDELEERDNAIEQMVDWFFEHYEDPAENVSFESAEGGYQWGGRGPHRAIDILSVEFPEYADDMHEKSASQIESDGTLDWAIQFHAMDDEDFDYEVRPSEPSGRSGAHFEMPEFDVPLQEPGGLVFAVNADGKVDLAKPVDIQNITGVNAVSTDAENALWDKIQLLSVSLSKTLSGSNAFPRLALKLADYNEVIISEDRVVGAVYIEGTLLRIQTKRDLARLQSGEAPDGVVEDLEDLLELHSTLIGSSVEGQKLLDGANSHAKSTAEVEALKHTQREFMKGAILSTDLLTPKAIQALESVTESSGEGPDPNVTAQIAETSSSNLIKVVAYLIKVGLLGGGTMIAGPIIQQSIAGAGAIEAGVLTVNFVTTWLTVNFPALHSLVGALCADSYWPQAFYNWLNWYEDTQ